MPQQPASTISCCSFRTATHTNANTFRPPGPKRKEKKEKNTQAVKTTPHINEGKGATLVPSTVKLLHREMERKNQWGSGGLQAWPETGCQQYPSPPKRPSSTKPGPCLPGDCASISSAISSSCKKYTRHRLMLSQMACKLPENLGLSFLC